MSSTEAYTNSSYISAGDMSGDITGADILMDRYKEISFIGTTSSASSIVGNLIVQESNDATTWVTMSTTAISADGSAITEKTVRSKWVRLFWDSTSGSATYNASYTVK